MSVQDLPTTSHNAPEPLTLPQKPNASTLEVLPGFWSQERQEAWSYALAGVSLERIAIALDRSRETVHEWVEAREWRTRMEKHLAKVARDREELLLLAETASMQSLPAHATAKGGGMIALEVLDRRRVLERRPDKLANADGSNLPAGVVVVLRPAAPPDAIEGEGHELLPGDDPPLLDSGDAQQ